MKISIPDVAGLVEALKRKPSTLEVQKMIDSAFARLRRPTEKPNVTENVTNVTNVTENVTNVVGEKTEVLEVQVFS